MKKDTWYRLVLIVWCFIIVSVPPVTLMGAEKPQTESAIGSVKSPIEIKSNTLEIDNNRTIMTFEGDVNVKMDDFTITCQKMVVHYINQKKPTGGAQEKVQIDKIVASGGVEIQRPDGGSATAKQAVYYQTDEKVVLTGDPVVKQGADFVEGATITLLLKENRSLVEGSSKKKARAVLTPRTE